MNWDETNVQEDISTISPLINKVGYVADITTALAVVKVSLLSWVQVVFTASKRKQVGQNLAIPQKVVPVVISFYCTSVLLTKKKDKF